jgi:hypothetical protein
MAKLRPEISKLCTVRTYADIEAMMKFLEIWGETTFEPLKEGKDDDMIGETST